MAAAISSPHQPASFHMHEMSGSNDAHSHALTHSRTISMSVDSPMLSADEDKLCAGCNKSVNSETGGVVVAFGSSLWHVDCFKCAKCSNRVNADTNLLLLSDGSPVCANCYNCKACNKPIYDEAVMTGDDSYHASCFVCRHCHKRIDELVFARTSAGFYCMKCHNERIARSRRHAAKKAKEKELQNSGSTSSRGGSSLNGSTRSKSNMPFSSNVSSPLGTPSSEPQSSVYSTPLSDGFPPNSRTPLKSRTPHSPDSSTFPNPHSQVIVNDATHILSNSDSNNSFADTSFRSTNSAADASFDTISTSVPVGNRDAGVSTSPSSWRSQSPATIKAELVVEDRQATPRATDPNRDRQNSAPPPYSLAVSSEGNHSGPASPQDTSSIIDAYGSVENGNSSPRYSTLTFEAAQAQSNSSVSNRSSESSAAASLYPRRGSLRQRVDTAPQEHRPGGETAEPVRRASYEDGPRPNGLSATMNGNRSVSDNPKASSSNLLAPSTTSIRNKRSSINPAMQLDASKFRDADWKKSFESPSSSGSSTARTHSPPLMPRGRDSPAMPSPLRDHFVAQEPVESRDISSTGSSRLIGSSTNEVLARPPQRLESLGGAIEPSKIDINGRALDARGRLSPNNKDTESGTRSRTVSQGRSAAPKADVPHNIGSGTDTEPDNELEYDSNDDTIRRTRDEILDTPPALPPKENKEAVVANGIQEAPDADAALSDSEGSEHSPTGQISAIAAAEIEQRSTSFMPQIRFSAINTDWGDVMKFVNPSRYQEAGQSDSAKDTLQDAPNALENGLKERENQELRGLTEAEGISSSPAEPSEDVTMKPSKASPRGNTSSSMSTKNRADPPGAIDIPPADGESGRSSEDHSSPLSSLLSNQSPRHAAIPRVSAEQFRPGSPKFHKREASVTKNVNGVEITTPDHASSASPESASSTRTDPSESVSQRLREALNSAEERGSSYIKLEISFADAILGSLDQTREQLVEAINKLDSLKRTSQQYIEGLTVAQDEFDKELAVRRDVEAEVMRLKVQLSGQTARLTVIAGEERKRELQAQLSQEISASLSGLEKDLSRLKVERDLTLAEVEELTASKQRPSIENGDRSIGLSRSLATKFDKIKTQYQKELLPLNEQRESLLREIVELKQSRATLLEETTVLSARHEELALLSAQYDRSETPTAGLLSNKAIPEAPRQSFDTMRPRQIFPIGHINSSSTASSTTLHDENLDIPMKTVEPPPTQSRTRGLMRWGNKKQDLNSSTNDTPKSRNRLEHVFLQLNVLRFARCDHCGDKMWGSQLRCSGCHLSVHPRCVNHVRAQCGHDPASKQEDPNAQMIPAPPSMFGRDLTEQVRADAKGDNRLIPVIVEKCIDAVEALGMDYEGIYRKTGGTGQSKMITRLFEQGNYDAFDLRDSETFNDISSVTSVLKNYFRSLPNPLLTYSLHESFVDAADIKDPEAKSAALGSLVGQLPQEHYHTLCHLMLHLHRIQLQSDRNKMTARNLGTVFGPTLMRSEDVGREFADMAGKALSIEWLVENAPMVFSKYLPI